MSGANISVSDAATASSHGFRSEEHTSELQSHSDLVCRLLLEKKNSLCQRERRHRPTDSAQDVEEVERPAAHPLCDRRAEDAQDQHVEQNERNAGLQEQVVKQR